MRSNDFHLIFIMVGRWNWCMVQQRPNLMMLQIRVLFDKSTLKRFLTLGKELWGKLKDKIFLRLKFTAQILEKNI